MTPGRISWSTTIIATCYFAMLQLWLGNSSEACSRTEETVQLATEDDWRALMPGMLFCKARHSYRLEKLNEVSPKSCCTKTWSCRLRGFSCLGRCYGSQALISQQADPMKDFITIDDALKLTQRTGTRVLDAEMLRLRGDLLSCGAPLFATHPKCSTRSSGTQEHESACYGKAGHPST
jgi:hypothetical protein